MRTVRQSKFNPLLQAAVAMLTVIMPVRANSRASRPVTANLGTGKNYNELVTGNIKQDPVGSTIAGVGMVGLGVATGGTPSFGMAGAGAVIGPGVNGAFQLAFGQSFDWGSFGMAGITGATSSGLGFVPALLINAGGAVTDSGMQGRNPNNAIVGAAIGTVIGYPVGSKIETNFGNVINPWYRQEWKDIGTGISVYVPKSPLPSWAGGVGSSSAQEILNDAVQKVGGNKK